MKPLEIRRTVLAGAALAALVAGAGQVQADRTAHARVAVEQDAPYGQYLVDAKGRALYMFTPDRGQRGSTCHDACAQAWPPLTTEGDPRAAAPSLDPQMLGTIQRRDGRIQVTYAGWPLYYYAGDRGPGEVNGQDIHSFGGEWYLLSPDGDIIKETRR